MGAFDRRPIRRTRNADRFKLDLNGDERAVLATIAPQLREALADPDLPGLRRLFPPAFEGDDDRGRQEEYVRLMRDDLVERHAGALEVLERTAAASELTGEELEAWARALNHLRLALGTRLDVAEADDPAEHDDPEHHLYWYLGYLQEAAVEALAGD